MKNKLLLMLRSLFCSLFVIDIFFLLPPVVQCQPNVPDEYKIPLEALDKFIRKVVEPLEEFLFCHGVRAKDPSEHPILSEFCKRILYLQNYFDYMNGKLAKMEGQQQQNIGAVTILVNMTFSTMKDMVASDLLERLVKERKWEHRQIVLPEVDRLISQPDTSEHYKVLELRLKNKVDELKLLQFQGDYSSERAKELAYECVYIGTKMVETFSGRQDRIGELNWALKQFHVDLLVYKMEIPELRDIRIEWEQQQDGTLGAVGLIAEGFEKAKAFLDYFKKKILSPLNKKCREINYEEKRVTEWLLCNEVSSLKNAIGRLEKILKEKERKRQKKEKGQQATSSNTEGNASKFRRIALLAKTFREIKIEVKMQMEAVWCDLPKHFEISNEFFYQCRFSNKGRKEQNAYFKDTLEKMMQLHSGTDFNSIAVKQMAFDCICASDGINSDDLSPVGQLFWAMQQITVNLMAFSMELPWARAMLPVQNITLLFEHTKAIQLLEKFYGQILRKLGKKCEEIGRKKEAKLVLEQSLCRTTFDLIQKVEHFEKALEQQRYSPDGGVKLMAKISSDIKEHVFLHDKNGFLAHLAAGIQKEDQQQKIAEEVDTKDFAGGANGLKHRFEEKLKSLHELLVKKEDFSLLQVKLVAFDCVYTGHWLVFGQRFDINWELSNRVLAVLTAVLRQFAVDLLVYGMEITEIRQIPDILLWTHGMD